MASQNLIASPDFDTIAVKAGGATRDAIFLLWSVLNQEISVRRSALVQVQSIISPAVGNNAPGAQQNDFNLDAVTVWYFTGAGAFTLTGIRNGLEGMIKIIHNTGAGTVTIANASASSSAADQLVTSTGANKFLTTNLTITFIYLNARWREWKPV